MDHVLENKFLNKEGAAKEALQEKDDEGINIIAGQSNEEAQFKVFESFVKEKYSLLGYLKAMIVYSVKTQGFEEEILAQLFPQTELHHYK
jgi:hypothetical protein